jgi:MYXO-CTERM domain-containing protein
MKWFHGVIVLVLGLGGGIACSTKSDELTLDRFGGEAARVICDKTYGCCTAPELMQHMDYSGGRAACGDKTKASLDFWAAVIEQERAKGRLNYDPGLARTCFDSYAGATCEQHKRNPVLLGCDHFVVPKVAPGSPCRASESCVGGSCKGVTPEADGVCVVLATEGGSCASATCAKGTFCNGSKICQRPKPDGETCGLHSECQSAGCNGRNPDAGTPGTCGPKGGEGTTCYVTTGCTYAQGGTRPSGALAMVVMLAALVIRRRRTRPREL